MIEEQIYIASVKCIPGTASDHWWCSAWTGKWGAPSSSRACPAPIPSGQAHLLHLPMPHQHHH